jgi:2-(1,2-epoxy-1,2-dihydrophenyl)acetyl-CoA isomerase
MNAPLIVAVNGVAAGAGFSFVGFADMVIASTNASFVSAYSKAGLTPDGSSTYFLPRIIGSRRYLELVMSNRILTANEALEWGLVNKVVDFNELKNESVNLAQQLAEGPSVAFGKLKNLVHNSFLDSLEGQMEFEARMISESAKTKDGINGVDAFVNKKKPSFKGE